MAKGRWTMDYNHGIDHQIWSTESGPWTIVVDIDCQVVPLESEPWNIVHGIDCQVWAMESGPW